MLVSKGTDLFVQDDSGNTALHHAAIKGHVAVLKVLATAGGLELMAMKNKDADRTAVEMAGFYRKKGAEEVLKQLEEKLTQELRACEERAKKMRDEYAANMGNSPLTVKEYYDVVYNVLLKTSTSLVRSEDPSAKDKFSTEAKEFVFGQFQHAAQGLPKLLNVPVNEIYRRIGKNGIAAIEAEVAALKNSDLSEQLDYILRRITSEKLCANGIRDKGRNGMQLKDFVEHADAKAAALDKEEVVALRLYTTTAFQYINNPLRDQQRINSLLPHPLPVTVTLISTGIKKLRAVDSGHDSAIRKRTLWRGMRNVEPTSGFAVRGGTEVSVCLLTQAQLPAHTSSPACSHKLNCLLIQAHLPAQTSSHACSHKLTPQTSVSSHKLTLTRTLSLFVQPAHAHAYSIFTKFIQPKNHPHLILNVCKPWHTHIYT
jgi:hypothetical protein